MLAAAVMPFCVDEMQFFVYCAYTLLVFSAMILYHRETSFKEVAVLYSMVVLIPCALNTLVSLRELNRGHGMFYVLIAVLSAWVADVGAFFAGTLFGRHKLCPEISPKKTEEEPPVPFMKPQGRYKSRIPTSPLGTETWKR